MLSYKYTIVFLFVWYTLQFEVRAEKLPVEDEIIKTDTVSVKPAVSLF